MRQVSFLLQLAASCQHLTCVEGFLHILQPSICSPESSGLRANLGKLGAKFAKHNPNLNAFVSAVAPEDDGKIASLILGERLPPALLE